MPVVLIEKESPQISVVTLNRPERRNALTLELLTELCTAINVASEQPEQRVLIFRGAGAAFCTGLDLKEAPIRRKRMRPPKWWRTLWLRSAKRASSRLQQCTAQRSRAAQG